MGRDVWRNGGMNVKLQARAPEGCCCCLVSQRSLPGVCRTDDYTHQLTLSVTEIASAADSAKR